MKAITVLQPWAWLLVSGKKRCETRPWKTDYRGEILIHAGKKDMTSTVMQQTFFEAKCMKRAGVPSAEIATGAVIGKAVLVNCVQIDETMRELIRKQHFDEYALGCYSPGRYAWVLENPQMFKNPIPASGKLGLWDFDGNL